MSNVFAVILTYNRRGLLSECLSAVSQQTSPCDRIIVVDNGSTDDTLDMLRAEWSGRVTVCALPQNIGAAGGFNAGTRFAYQEGADYIWLMDDDVIPETDALERLLDADETLREREIFAPFVISNATTPAGLSTNTPELHVRQNAVSYATWPLLLDRCIVPVGRATFVSILFPRETIKRYGLPIAEMFMWGEDMEFTMRITRDGPGYLVGDSRVVHVRALSGAPDIRTERNPARIRYFYYLKRNQMFMRRRLRHGSITKHVLRQLKLAAELIIQREFYKARLVVTGTLDGLAFNPPLEKADGASTLEAVSYRTIPSLQHHS
jgi:dTDP-4-dehydrorhamnose reductase